MGWHQMIFSSLLLLKEGFDRCRKAGPNIQMAGTKSNKRNNMEWIVALKRNHQLLITLNLRVMVISLQSFNRRKIFGLL